MPPYKKSKQHRAQWLKYLKQRQAAARVVVPSGAAENDQRLNFVFPIYLFHQVKRALI
jgi:hypothetical protein